MDSSAWPGCEGSAAAGHCCGHSRSATVTATCASFSRRNLGGVDAVDDGRQPADVEEAAACCSGGGGTSSDASLMMIHEVELRQR